MLVILHTLFVFNRLYTVNQDQVAKRRSLQLPGVHSIRRMSIAALNFLSPAKYGSKGNFTKDDDIKDVENAKRNDTGGRRTGRLTCPHKPYKKRYSLCDPEYEDMYEYINNFTYTRMKQANVYTALKKQIGNLEKVANVSPVLEQTSISDFLLIVNSLTANATTQGSQNSVKGDSPLFTLFQNQPATKIKMTEPCSRRYSLTVPQAQPSNIARNKSFSSKARRLSPVSRLAQTRTQSVTTLSFPKTEKLRSQSISTGPQEGNLSTGGTFTNVPSRKIRRFSIKPVNLTTLTAPEIVISGPSREGSMGRKQSHRISKWSPDLGLSKSRMEE